ncbi:MAG: VTT domain-containing protein [Bacteroidales bacterium]
MEDLAQWGYLGMFISAFLSGSIIPANSEIVMSAVLALGLDKWWVLTAATAGNLLGGMSCYYLGYLGSMEKIVKYMRVKREKVEKVHRFLDGRGAWLAFFVFVPFVGDLIIVVFGLMRSNFLIVCIAMFFGKLFKYLIWMAFTLGLIEWFK